MKKVCVFLADGFEEVEALTVVDLLRRADIDVQMVSIADDLFVTSARSIVVKADALFTDVDYEGIDMLVLPGGLGGTDNLSKHEGLLSLIKQFDLESRKIAAICAAPTILGMLGILKGRNAVCYPGNEDQLTGASVSGKNIEISEHITTSKAMGTAIDFSLALIAQLVDETAARNIKEAIVYRADTVSE